MNATAAIVLAGGDSARMGTAKAALEWHGSTLLRHAAGIVARAVDGPVVVVRAAGQQLPALPAGVAIATDARAGRGPLEGIAAGLAAIGDRAQIVYVTGVDAPFLHPAFVRHVLAQLGPQEDVALPRARGFAQPLAAAYRTTVAAALRALLDDGGRLGTRALLARCRVVEIDDAALLADPGVAALDPQLESLRNLNEPASYAVARARPAPQVSVSVAGRPARRLRAATLIGAASAAGLAPVGDLRATINGTPAGDPRDPLVAGDVVTLERSW